LTVLNNRDRKNSRKGKCCFQFAKSPVLFSTAVSDATFFSKEDAKSVKEMVKNFTPRNLPSVPDDGCDATNNKADEMLSKKKEKNDRDAKTMKTAIGRKVTTNETHPSDEKQNVYLSIHTLEKIESLDEVHNVKVFLT